MLLFSLATVVLLGPAETRQLESVQLQATAQLIAGGFAAAQDQARDQQAPVLITLNRAAPTGTLSIENGM